MTLLEEKTEATTETTVATKENGDHPVPVTRGRIDVILIALGAAAAVVLLVAGGLLTWGSTFAGDYVSRELADQKISFPPAAALEEEGRDDLVQYGGQQVDTGAEAEAYASYIQGHVDGMADGRTFSELREPQVAAEEAVNEAVESGAPNAEVAQLQAELDEINGLRMTVFQGEVLRGTLLSTYAWATIGQIAGIAALVAFVAAGVMVVLVVLGMVHLRRMHRSQA
ncbi:MAG TPA: hypothetical protein PKA98_14040 [Acidimicrobiales bacterium]|nr:hypothetical protein [Acidimicrobiales bacterium]